MPARTSEPAESSLVGPEAIASRNGRAYRARSPARGHASPLHDFPVSPPVVHSLSGLERVEQRVKALESQLHDTEYRLRMDLLQRDSAWRERITAALSPLCRLLG